MLLTFVLEKNIDELEDRVGNAVSTMEGVDIPSLKCQDITMSLGSRPTETVTFLHDADTESQELGHGRL